MLPEYLVSHETEMEKIVSVFERQADPKAARACFYDCIQHYPIRTHVVCDDHYTELDSNRICAGVFNFHEQIISLYPALLAMRKMPNL